MAGKMVETMATQSVLREAPTAGFNEELVRAEKEVALLTSRCKDHPWDLQGRVRLAYRMFHRASLTGKLADLEQVEAAILQTIHQFGPKEDLCLLKANLDFRLHRLAGVRHDLEMAPLLPGRFDARVLQADLAFQEGQYEVAHLALQELIRENPTWDTIARLAHWKSKLGEPAEADKLYEQAEEDLTAKQMLSYAWLELQRGMLDFNHGRYPEAWAHYRRAEAGYPGHWHTAEHFAELHAAEGNFDEAETILKQVIARTSKPEIQQALGELYVFTDRPEQAQPWFDSALATYLDSVRRGGVHYLHHLADFYADARLEPAEALRWAEQDMKMRPNFSTQSTLAWALFRNGRVKEALEYIGLALDSGVRDAVICSCASELFGAAGETARSVHFAELALQTNPKHRNFRMHH
jgi:tetratricopeptide (TPR) repeat protein